MRVGKGFNRDIVNGKFSVYAELLVPLRLVAILETKKLKLLSFFFMISK